MSKSLLAAAAFMALTYGGAAQATQVLTFTVSGTFDTLDADVSPNSLSGLLGKSYTMSASLGVNSATLISTALGDSDNEKGWFFNTHSSLTTDAFKYGAGATRGGVVADVTNDLAYDGSQGVVPAGTYDIIQITGWLRGAGPAVDPVACPNRPSGDLLGDGAPGPCSLAGFNSAVDITLIGSSGLVSTLNGVPFGSLDLSKALYVQTELRTFKDGYTTGDISQDPAVTYHDGILTGDGLSMRAAVTSVPEPSTWALMLVGLGAVGVVARRRLPIVTS